MAAVGELKCGNFESVLEDIDSTFILKEEQRHAIKAFVDQKDVFAVLPTGSGKSLSAGPDGLRYGHTTLL